MQILDSIHESLQAIGLSSYQSMQTYPFNERNVISSFIFGLNIISNVGFLVSGQSETLMDFTDSMYIIFTVIFAASIFIKLIWKMQQLFGFINRLEDTVNQSK